MRVGPVRAFVLCVVWLVLVWLLPSGASASVGATHFSVSVSTPVSAGAPFTLTARALDGSNHLVSSFDGPANFSDTSGELSGAPTSFVNGVATTSSASIADPFHLDRVTVASDALSGQSGLFNVFGSLDHITVNVATPVSAGSGFKTSALAYDSAGNFLRIFDGPASFSDSSGELTGTPTSFVNGIATTSSASIADPYHLDRVTVSSGGVSAQSGVFNVFGTLNHVVAGVATPVSAGSAFKLYAWAYDSAGNFLRIFDGPASFSDSSGELTGTPTSFTNGIAATSSASIADPYHLDRVTVSSGAVSAQSRTFNVFGPLDHFAVSGPSRSILTSDTFTVTATARDAAGNVLSSYWGPATWSDSSGTLSPASPSDFVAGISKTTSASVGKPWSGDEVTIQSGGKQGSSAPFDVKAGAPVLSNIESGTLQYDAGAPAAAVTSSLTVSSATATLAGATVSITSGLAASEDSLAFADQNGITGSYDSSTGVLTLSGSASVADYQAALQSVTYSDSNGTTPSTGSRTVSFQVDDGLSSHNLSNMVSRTVNVNPNSAPTAGPVTASTDKNTATDINVLTSASDPDGDPVTLTSVDTTGTKGSVSINPDSTVHYDPNGQFQNLTAGQTATDTFGYTVSDGFSTASGTVTVTVNGVNDAPVISNVESTALGYHAQDPAVAITSTLTLSDDDDATIAGAKASITSGFDSGQDTLGFSSQNGITGSYDSTTGVLTLSGNATIAQYQSALRSVTFFTSDGSTSPAARTVSFAVTDSLGASSTSSAHRTIDVSEVNQPPTAVDHSYTAVGNTAFGVGTTPSAPAATVSGSLLNGASDPDSGGSVSVTAHSTPGHGTVAVNADGTFTYMPDPGFSGTDSFTYTITDSDDSGNPKTATATATITVGTVVWYVDNSKTGSGNGESISPFNTLAAANSAAGANSIIFLYQGNATYTGGVSMKSGEDLFGQPHGLSVGGYSLLPASGSNPTITNSGGNGVDLGEGSDVEAVNISSPSGNGVASSSINSATVGGTYSVAISNAGGDGVHISGGNGTLTFTNTSVSGSTGHSVLVTGRTGGTASFGGAVSDSSEGISLTSNTGATINFAGTLTLSTGANTAFSATGGGTIAATGTGSTVNTTTGTALDVENTTIGSSNLTFQSVSANGGSNGIVLYSTGSSGHLAVTGNGSAGSGGSIQGIGGSDVSTSNCADLGSSIPSGVGVYLKSTSSPSLAYMSFPGVFGNFGILGYGVSGFTLDHTTMTGTYGDNAAQYESAVMFCGLTGSAGITNDSISGGRMGNFTLINTSGTLNRLTMSSDTFGLNNGTDGNDSVQLLPYNSGTVLDVTVEDSTFQGARAVPFSFEPQNGATSDLVFGQPGHGNTVHNTIATPVGAGQDLQYTPDGPATFDINANTFDVSSPLNSTAEGGVLLNASENLANAQGHFRNNTIGEPGTNDSGTTGGMPALDMESNGGGVLTVSATNNQIYQFNSVANGAVELIGSTSGATSGSIFNVTFTGNTIADPGTYNKAQVSAGGNNATGFHLDSGTLSTDAFTMCLDMAGNTLNGSGDAAAAGDARIRQRFNTKVNMPGYTAGPGSTGIPSYIQGLNPTGPPTVTAVSSTTSGGGFFNASCVTPNF